MTKKKGNKTFNEKYRDNNKNEKDNIRFSKGARKSFY